MANGSGGHEDAQGAVRGGPVSAVQPPESSSTSTRVGPSGVPGALAADLAELEGIVDRMTALDLSDLDGSAAAAVLVCLRHLAGRLTVTADQALPVIEADGLWALDGSASLASWAARATGTPLALVRRELRVARALRDLPVTLHAARAGTITPHHARSLATAAASSPARAATMTAAEGPNEALLVAHARSLHPDPFTTLVRHWATHADPDAADRAYRDAADREHVNLARTLDGYHLRGFLTDEHGQALSTALEALVGVPAATDTRNPAQRRARALHDLARHALDHPHAGTGAAVRPHLSVLVPIAQLDDLEATGGASSTQEPTNDLTPWVGEAEPAPPHEPQGLPQSPAVPQQRPPVPKHGPPAPPEGLQDRRQAVRTSTRHDRQPLPPSPPEVACYEDGAPVPRDVLARLACDSEITRIVLGAPGVVLDVGRTRRTVTRELRRAVIARDRHCAFPDCTTPPARCEVHHPHHWARGGVTSVTNSVLLCWHHHEWVHRQHITIDRVTDADTDAGVGRSTGTGTGGRTALWAFTDRHGSRIEPAPAVVALPG